MRITVSVILKLIANGRSTQEVIQAYPELEPEDISRALKYAAWLASENTKPINGVEVKIA